eukprot:11848287-Alexandrium_andersonii.AAC.1
MSHCGVDRWPTRTGGPIGCPVNGPSRLSRPEHWRRKRGVAAARSEQPRVPGASADDRREC